MKFSEKIVRLRKIKGITQDELAGAVGVSRQAVYKWECGQSYPEVAKLIELKALFGISIDDLLDESFEIALPDRKRRKRAPRAKVEKAKEAQTEAAEPIEEVVTVVEVVAEPEPVEEAPLSVAEEVAALAEETAVPEEVVPEEVVPEEAPEETPEEAPAPAEQPKEEPMAAPERKRGFFSRLFGRK